MEIKLNDQKYLKSYSKLSKNDNESYIFIDSEHKAIDFDNVKDDFQQYLSKCGKNISGGDTFLSCDAILIQDDKYIFIEFKDAKISSQLNIEINKKIIHSCFLLEHITNHSVFDMHIDFILVYSKSKNNEDENKIANNYLKQQLEKKSKKMIRFVFFDTMKKMINNSESMTEDEFIDFIETKDDYSLA